MTANEFRKLALSFPEASEGEHMDHPDFRVRNRIFATLGPGEQWGMVKLSPAQQTAMVRAAPRIFEPLSGAWGRGGATRVCLEAARRTVVREALTAAWRNTAPKRLVQQFDEEQ